MKLYQSSFLTFSLVLLSLSPLSTHAAVVFQAPPKHDQLGYPTKLEDFKHKNDEFEASIIGGRPVYPPFKYSDWLVAIQKDDFQFCAGSIFGPGLVVTAAHCSILGFPLDTLTVNARRFNLELTSSEEQGIELQVESITVHPDFDLYTLENDIAIWHVTGWEQLEVTVRLDNGVNSWVGRNCTAIGWGSTVEGGAASPILNEVWLPIVSEDYCKKVLGSRIVDSMICAGAMKGRDACQGDSGGPLVVMRDFERPVLVGVISWGKGCAREGYPGVYTRISYFRTWLRSFLPNPEIDADEELFASIDDE